MPKGNSVRHLSQRLLSHEPSAKGRNANSKAFFSSFPLLFHPLAKYIDLMNND